MMKVLYYCIKAYMCIITNITLLQMNSLEKSSVDKNSHKDNGKISVHLD